MLTVTDIFAGAGGSSTGMSQVPGYPVRPVEESSPAPSQARILPDASISGVYGRDLGVWVYTNPDLADADGRDYLIFQTAQDALGALEYYLDGRVEFVRYDPPMMTLEHEPSEESR